MSSNLLGKISHPEKQQNPGPNRRGGMNNFRRSETQSRQLNPRVNELNRGALLSCETLGTERDLSIRDPPSSADRVASRRPPDLAAKLL